MRIRGLKRITAIFLIAFTAIFLKGGHSLAVDLSRYEVVDLTHPLNGGVVYFPGDSSVSVTPKKGQGEDPPYLYDITMSDRSGTHVVLPSRWGAAYPTADRIEAGYLVGNAVVINVEGAVEKDPDYSLDSGHIMRWEDYNGPVPNGSIVLVETGWDRHWGDETIYFNFDKNRRMHFPGISVDGVRYLTEKRGVTVIGIDTPGLDPGFKKDLEASRLMAEIGGIVVLNLKNLRRLPPTGAAVFIGLLPLGTGGGSPARVLGLIPKGME